MTIHDMRRSGAPVRRHSREAGKCEGVFWGRFDRLDVGRYMLAAERFERTRRKPGERSGPLGFVAIEVFRELLRLVDYRSGRLEPAIETIMRRCKRSRDAVCRALARLREHGFLDWLRRWEPGDTPEQPVKQTTNAYRLLLPKAARVLLGLDASDAPIPEDEESRRDAAQHGYREALMGMDRAEQGTAALGDTPLGRALNRFGATFKKKPEGGQNPAQDFYLES